MSLFLAHFVANKKRFKPFHSVEELIRFVGHSKLMTNDFHFST